MSIAPPNFNPFPGLRSFTQDEDYLFFGREEQALELLARLSGHRFVAVVGASGSGKSSLVRCGLLSELQGGKMRGAGAAWEFAVTHPGGNPLGLLTDALLDAHLYERALENTRENLLATLSRSHFGLIEAVKQAGLRDGTNFLIIVDQFEEIFRFHEAGQTQQEMASEFVSLLLEAAAQNEVPIYVVVTMRSDFIGECGQFEGLAEAVNRSEFLIPRLTRELYKRVIEGPIRVAGGKITPRLLQRLLNDLGQQADPLPCLQHALMRTWNVWAARNKGDAARFGQAVTGPELDSGGRNELRPLYSLDLEDYQRVGKMSHAMSLHADEIYDALATDRQRQLCRGLFQALTVQESENRGIRRPQRLGRLCQILNVAADELLPIIDAYRQHGVTFLMPAPEVQLSERTIIDISHESLMRVWMRLRNWALEEVQAAGIYRRLSESAALHEQGKAGLYRDPELGIALAWQESQQPNAAWAERYHPGFAAAMAFLARSQEANSLNEQAREAARQRELEQAQQLAEAQRLRLEQQQRSAGKLRKMIAGLAAVAVFAGVACALALIANQRANTLADLARQNEERALRNEDEAKQNAVRAEQSEQKTANALATVAAQKAEVEDSLSGSLDYFSAALKQADGYDAKKPIVVLAARFDMVLSALVERQPHDQQLQLALARKLAERGQKHLTMKQPAKAQDELEKSRAIFARLLTPSSHWQVLTPVAMKAETGAKMELQNDGSVFVHKSKSANDDTYVLAFQSNLQGITGLRLEVLADTRLPRGGPGWADTGNFLLNELTLEAAPSKTPGNARPIALRNASADYSPAKGDVRGAVDGNGKTGWSILPEVNQDHMAIFELAEKVGDGQAWRLTVRLNHQHASMDHRLGRFRLSFANDARTLQATHIRWDLQDREVADCNIALGKAYARQGLTKEALVAFTEALRLAADRAGKARIIAEAAPFEGVLAKLAEGAAGDGGFQAELARYFAEAGNAPLAKAAHAKARTFFEAKLAKEPENSAWAAELGQVLWDWADNAPEQRRVVAIQANPWVTLAAAYAANGLHAEALQFIRKALERADGYDARKPILEVAARFDDILAELIKRQPDDPQLQLALARRLVERGKQRLAQKQPGQAQVELETSHAIFTRLLTSANYWNVVKPVEMKAESGARMEMQKDGSVFVHQEPPGKNDTYTLVLPTELKDITGLRLEVLADARLPSGGPGWSGNGNFHLSKLTLEATPANSPDKARAIALRDAWADYSHEKCDVRGVVDGKGRTGWAILPEVNKNHTAIFELAEKIGDGSPLQLTVRLFHQDARLQDHNLGRFRLSFTNDRATVQAPRLGRDLQDSELVDLYVALGTAHGQQGRTKQAVNAFTEALQLTRDRAGKVRIIAAAAPLESVAEKLTERAGSDGELQVELAQLFTAQGQAALADAARAKARTWMEGKLAAEPEDFAGAGPGLKLDDALIADDPTVGGKHVKAYSFKMMAGKTYVIDMITKEDDQMKFDPYLRLQDPSGQVIAEDDDSGDSYNARITFTCTKAGTYKILATTYKPNMTGRFLLTTNHGHARSVVEDLADLLLMDSGAKWAVLKPTEMKSDGGATLTLQPDGSILASGKNPDQDTYTITARVDLERIRAIRLEALPNAALPLNDPGRSPQSGSFALHRIRVFSGGTPATLTACFASYDRFGKLRPIVDGKIDEDVRDIFPQSGRRHIAVFGADISHQRGDELKFEVSFLRGKEWGDLSRFRLSVSDDPACCGRERHRLAALKLTDPSAKLAAAYHILGDQQALDKLRKRRPASRTSIGDLYAAAQDWELAIAEYRPLVADQPTDVALLIKLAAAHQGAGRTREGVPYLAQASAADPKDTNLSLKVAALQAWFGQEKDLAATRQRILTFAQGANDALTAERAARACSIVPSADKAELKAAVALALTAANGDNADNRQDWALLALGVAEYRNSNFANADEYLRAAVKAARNDPYVTGIASFYLSMSWFHDAKEDEARKLATAAAVKMAPLPADEHNPLAGDTDFAASDNLILWLAYKEAKAMLQIEAAPAANWLMRALADQRRGETGQARKACRQAAAMLTLAGGADAALRPLLRQTVLALGMQAPEAKELIAAAGGEVPASLNEAIQQDRGHAEPYRDRGDWHAQRGRWRDAIADYAEAFRLDPNTRVAMRLGVLLAQNGEKSRLHEHCQAMLRRWALTEKNEEADQTLKTILLVPGYQGDAKQLARLAEAAVAGDPTRTGYEWWLVGKALHDLRAGRYADALTACRASRQRAGNDARPVLAALDLTIAAMALEAAGKSDDARRTLAEAKPWIESAVPGIDVDKWWTEWLAAHILYREAVGRILHKPG
jgi:hypothetical protein